MLESVEPPISVTKTVYTVTDFLEWQRQRALNLRPYFQRGDVWTPKAKSYLIDTLIRGYPVPIIYLQNKQDRQSIKNVRQVVDGQQRLRTILAYIEPESLPDLTDRDKFTILKSHNKHFAGKRFHDLPAEIQDRITTTELSVHVLPSNLSDRHLLQLFARLNSTGERLNDQELRNAEYHGEFKTLAYSLAYEQLDRWQEWGIFTPRYLTQMREVELTSELMVATLSGMQAKSKTALDSVYRRFDDEFPYAPQVSSRMIKGFDFIDELYRVFASRGDYKKVQTQSWLYTFFVGFDLTQHGKPLLENPDQPQFHVDHIKPKELQAKATRVLESLNQENIPDKLTKALRGASTDLASRSIRLEYLLDR